MPFIKLFFQSIKASYRKFLTQSQSQNQVVMRKFYSFLILFACISLALASGTDPTDEDDSEKPRIVNGTLVEPGGFPYFASLFLKRNGTLRFQCGGAIIGPRLILSADHCFVRVNEVFVRVGVTSEKDSGQYLGVVDSFYPRDHGDVTIMILNDTIKLNKYAKIAPIAGPNYNLADGSIVTVAGYGLTSEDGETSKELMSVSLKVVNLDACKKALEGKVYPPTEKHFCAYEDGKDACQGDSGGGAIHEGVLVGVVSYGKGCARPGLPGVYLKVSKYYHWIKPFLDEYKD